MNIDNVLKYLKEYDGEPITIMEVCGTHTASINKNAIPCLLSDRIKLVSGPGCPVCVSVTQYIDKLCEMSQRENTCVVSFGDMIRVPGSNGSLKDSKAAGGKIKMVYSPFEIIPLAQENPNTKFIFAAVGFETTTPIYALLLEELENKKIENVKLMCSLKTMPAVIDRLCSENKKIDGFLAPGHVSVITGSDCFLPLAEKYKKPFVVSGFEPSEILASIYALTKLKGKGVVKNLYKSAVRKEENKTAAEKVNKYFEVCDACWRGLGVIEGSGLKIRDKYKKYNAFDGELNEDNNAKGCSCAKIIRGESAPCDCPLFGNACTPTSPKGACMVSTEGSCFNSFINR